jgi:23S rRNA-/tRNA-specific pseudouridylate synthase
LLVCDKPAGLMVEPDRNNYPNLLQKVKKYLQEKSGMRDVYVQHLHRLDRPVSGIVLFVKNRNYLRNLSEQFAQRLVKKKYRAITSVAPEQHQAELIQWHRKEKKKACIVPEDTEYAEQVKLSYDVQSYGKYYAWNIVLHTGKFHQIRAQLSSIHCPIIGDILYGSDVVFKENTIALHASSLDFFHPVTNTPIQIVSKPGPDWDVFNVQ